MSQTNPTPKLVTWTGYFAITLLLALPVAVLTVRSGAWQQGLLLYAISCAGAAILLALAVIMMMLPRLEPWRKAIAGRALLTLPGAALLLSLLGGAGDHPRIHDISTDLQDPPIFAAAEQQRGEHSNSLQLDPATIELQRQGYPDLHTSLSTLAIDDAFDRAIEVANAMDWEIYHQDRNAGVIEAVDTTALMAFKDDVVIRVRSNADGTLIDLRSVSRVGVGDFGANAKRIRAFQQRLQQ
jgi:Protein of unknown function (DUF1499)